MKTIYAYSHIGNSRKNQEDNYFIGKDKFLKIDEINEMSLSRKMKFDSSLSKYVCCCVSDGMGGHKYGEVASFSVVSYFDFNYKKLLSNFNLDKSIVIDFIRNLNNFVVDLSVSNIDLKNMGATLCGLVYFEDKGLCFNVGDSRAYKISSDGINKITTDNTYGQRLLDLGLLSEEEFKNFSQRKVIYKYIGREGDLIPDIYEINELKNKEYLLLCSDGLYDVLSENEILDIMLNEFISTKDKGKFLVDIAVERKLDSGDNVTLVIVEG